VAESNSGPGLEDIPEARAESSARRRLPLVWLVPLVAVLVGGWLAVTTILARGPTATITFRTAEGLEVGKTKIRFKDVEIGIVREIGLSGDHAEVIVTAEFAKDAGNFLVQDSRFWVVRPRISGGGVSGLGTFLSGAYIGADYGKSTERRTEFVGLEVPPILTTGLPGREFALRADDLGSIGYATPVYYRRLQVREVTAYELDEGGGGVSIRIFVHAPYDGFVTTETRFWQASGIDVSLDASGIRVQTESLASILLGGVAFGTPPHAPAGEPATRDSLFKLSASRVDAFTKEDTRVQRWVLLFQESVRGLQVGAPVDFRGITVGEVVRLEVDYLPDKARIDIPVEIRYFPDRMRSRARERTSELSGEALRAVLDRWVARGFRGQLRTGNLLTGQKYVALDFFPDAPQAEINWNKPIPELPTLSGGIEELQSTLTRIAAKLDKLPYEEIANDLRTALRSLDKTLKGVDTLVQRLDTETAPELKALMLEARGTLSTAEKTLSSVERTVSPDAALAVEAREALREINRAAAAIRGLADYLERHPESLIRGKEAK
jgi:paraquat-inducible protein B